MPKYIYQYANWPNFSWDNEQIQVILGKVRHLQGQIMGRMGSFGFSIKEEAVLETLTTDVVRSSQIEGEVLDPAQVRLSIASRLGINLEDTIPSNRDVDGIVEMLLDATQNYQGELTNERLFDWYASIFPTGRSGMVKIETGRYRSGTMQVVSGPMGKETVHFIAPPHDIVEGEMNEFLLWLNSNNSIDSVLKSAIAHLWFIIIHPFDDGNGRIARAISDMLLARSDNSPNRFYSLSNQILKERKIYYETLQEVQHSEGDITIWIDWYLNCLYRALIETENTTRKIVFKSEFWDKHKNTELNSRQRLMLNKLLDGFEGKLKTSKWAKITKCSPDTALRDIKDLMSKKILRQEESGGRSTNYELVKD